MRPAASRARTSGRRARSLARASSPSAFLPVRVRAAATSADTCSLTDDETTSADPLRSGRAASRRRRASSSAIADSSAAACHEAIRLAAPIRPTSSSSPSRFRPASDTSWANSASTVQASARSSGPPAANPMAGLVGLGAWYSGSQPRSPAAMAAAAWRWVKPAPTASRAAGGRAAASSVASASCCSDDRSASQAISPSGGPVSGSGQQSRGSSSIGSSGRSQPGSSGNSHGPVSGVTAAGSGEREWRADQTSAAPVRRLRCRCKS